jgi:hypothetical protein
MKAALYISLLIITIYIYGCVDSAGLDTARIEPQKAEILPLADGNFWNYEVWQYKEDGELLSYGETYHSIISAENGWYVQEQGTPGINAYLQNSDEGLLIKSGPAGTPGLVVPYPVNQQAEVFVSSYKDAISGQTISIYRIATGVNQKITTRAGSFTSIKYIDITKDESGNVLQNPLNVLFYAPNYGLILRYRYKEKQNGTLYIAEHWELNSFTLNKVSD